MNDELLISICVLTYNRSEHLKRVLSFLRNELSNLDNKSEVELIISDNCSTDDTPAVIKEFITNIGNGYNIRVQRNKENLGLLGNLLRTAEISSGKYHWWWGDDDYYKEGIIRRVIAECRKNPYHIFINHSVFVKEPGDNLDCASRLEGINLNSDDPTKELIIKNISSLMFISGNVYLNSKLKKALASPAKKNIAFPLYCSLFCIGKGKSIIIGDVLIDDNAKEISWNSAMYKVFLYYMPYYVSLMPELGFEKEFSCQVWEKWYGNIGLKRIVYKIKELIRPIYRTFLKK